LVFETIAVIVMLLVSDDYVFVISDIARAIKTFAVPCQLIQGFLKRTTSSSSSAKMTSNLGTSQVASGQIGSKIRSDGPISETK
jgi:hypothetical protein